jgi:CHAT domain-containing protein
LLSATGIGEVKNGEGVHGLRRALVLAEAETFVMSLWPVSDQITRELITAYYIGLAQGEGRGEALRQVQSNMIKRVGRRSIRSTGPASFSPENAPS